MKPLLALLFALAATPALAALSPFYDCAEQIETILHNPGVADVLGQAPLRGVENTGTRADGASEWTVRTQDCDLVVYLVAVPPADGMVGKTSYTLDLSKGCE